MIWMQAGACFVAWALYGLWMRRSSERMRARMHSASRGSRVLLGSVGLLLGLAFLAVGLWLVSIGGGLTDNGLVPWAWLAVAVIGLGFIHLQVLGAAAMLSLVLEEETTRVQRSSVSMEKEPK